MNIPCDIWHIKGVDENGPNVVVLGGTHGDEIVGVLVVERLLQMLGLKGSPCGTYKSDRIVSGSLFVGFGNPEAMKRNTRAAEAGPDLNRSFSQTELRAIPRDDDRFDLCRARELMPLFERTDFLFDVHSTSFPSVPFVCMGNDTPEHKTLYSLMPVSYVLTDPYSILSQDAGRDELATTDYAVNVFGGSDWSVREYGCKRGVGLCYESGYKDDLGQIEDVFPIILRLLQTVGIFELECELAELMYEPSVYKLVRIVKAQYDGFDFAEGMQRGWQIIHEGDVLGYYGDEEEIVSLDGMLLFPKGKSSFLKGDTLCYIAEMIR